MKGKCSLQSGGKKTKWCFSALECRNSGAAKDGIYMGFFPLIVGLKLKELMLGAYEMSRTCNLRPVIHSEHECSCSLGSWEGRAGAVAAVPPRGHTVTLLRALGCLSPAAAAQSRALPQGWTSATLLAPYQSEFWPQCPLPGLTGVCFPADTPVSDGSALCTARTSTW